MNTNICFTVLLLFFIHTCFSQELIRSNDVANALPLCSFEQINVQGVTALDVVSEEINSAHKLDAVLISNRPLWLVFKSKEAVEWTFTITPDDPLDDLDFIVFESRDIANSIEDLYEVRFMSSGANAGSSVWNSIDCLGATGLKEGSEDKIEFQGCNEGDDNFLAPIPLEKSKYYYVMINNYSGEAAYTITFDQQEIDLEDLSDRFSLSDNVVLPSSNALCGVGTTVQDEEILQVAIFPNPVRDLLSIEFDNTPELSDGDQLRFNIIDESGRSVLKSQQVFSPTLKIDVSTLIQGNYFIYFENGEELIRKQFHKM